MYLFYQLSIPISFARPLITFNTYIPYYNYVCTCALLACNQFPFGLIISFFLSIFYDYCRKDSYYFAI